LNFDLPAEDDPRRVAVRAWFSAHPDASWPELAEAGYIVPHWPRPWGLAAEPELQLIIDDEIARAGLIPPNFVNPVAINNCGQSLLTFGSDEQRQRFLPPALACTEIWCMLFSEPSAGSDLAALRTTATRTMSGERGDGYLVNGQKIWTSLAHKSDIGVLVARTDPAVPKHMGLSQFLVDMNCPGITIRPIIDMSGQPNEYNEVFFDDVFVPADRLIGKAGDGWQLTMQQLQTERVALSKPGAIWGSGPTARDLVDGLIETGRIKDPLIRDEAAKIYIEGELVRLLNYRTLSDRIHARSAGPEGAISKMLAAPHGQHIVDLAKRSQGAAGLIEGEEVLPFANSIDFMFSDWDYAFWFNPAVTLGVGTQEVLKNVVAERMLGLPREVDPTMKTPWQDLSRAGGTR
jgi:3-oxochol-4-en-24-oyl-CoA dehydrogenase